MVKVIIDAWDGIDDANFIGENIFELVAETIALRQSGVTEDIFTANFSTGGTGLTNFSERMLFDTSALSASGNAGSLRIQFHSHPSFSTNILRAYVGHRAPGGNAFDFDGGQVELKFSGLSGFSIGANTIIWSDDTIFPFDITKDLIIAYDYGVLNPNISANSGIPESVTPYRSTTGGGTPGEAPDSIPASVYTIVGGDTTRVHNISDIELLPSYPTGGKVPGDVWTPFPVDTVLFSTDARLPENNNPGDAGDVLIKWKANGGAFSALLTQAQFRNEFPLGLIIADPIESISIVCQYTSDGAQKTTTDKGMEMQAQFPSSVCNSPSEDDVRSGSPSYGPNLEFDGNYEPADPTLYAQNEQYGANGTEFTGSKVVTQFQNPVEVILEDAEIILFEGD